MAENETNPTGAPLGNRTIKLSPMTPKPLQTVAPTQTRTQAIPLKHPGGAVPLHSSNDFADQPTATVQINRPVPKPVSTHSVPINTNSGPIPIVPKKMTVKPVTQKIPIPTQSAPAPAPESAPANELPPEKPVSNTSSIHRVATATTRIKVTGIPTKKLDLTATTGIKTTGIRTAGIRPSAATIKLDSTPAQTAGAAPTPAPAAEENDEQTRTVVINRKKVTPADPAAAAPPLVAKAAPAGPLGTSTLNLNNISASGKTIRLGTAPAPAAASAGNNVQTQTASVKIDGIPSPAASTIKLGASPTSTVQGTASGIKLGTVSGAPSIKLGGTVNATKTSLKLGGTATATNPSIKLGGTAAAAPAANTESVPSAPTPPSQTASVPGGLKIKKQEEPPAVAEAKKPEGPAAKDSKAAQAEKAKKLAMAKAGGEPNLFFSITSIAALLAIIVLAAVIATQYLNHWEDMNIQLPGLNYLTLNK